MKTEYHFNRNQIAALDELLEQRDLLRELIEDVYSVSGDTAALLRDLPEDLSPEREAVVRSACSLVGKVNYFWGGKSLVIGWDVRWGELRQVTAAGNSTTGTYRPYGLDCSGFVDWVFFNQSGGSYVIGHGGGATMQPATWCFTRIIPMWVLLAAGTQTVNCSLFTAPADITMWLLPARRALSLSVDHNTTASSWTEKALPSYG